MSVERLGDEAGRSNALLEQALADLAVPLDGRGVHQSAGGEVAGAAAGVGSSLAAVVHHLDSARTALNRVREGNGKMESLLKALPASEVTDIASAVGQAAVHTDQAIELGIGRAHEGTRALAGTVDSLNKLAAIQGSAPDVQPAANMFNSAHGITQAIIDTL